MVLKVARIWPGGTTIVCCTGAVKKVDCENQGREKICLSSGRRSSCRRSWIGSFSGPIRTSTVSLCRRAVARNMPWLATPIADLACRVQGTTVGCSAISRDMTLVSSVTKHQLCKTHDPRACHMHSISLPELDSRVHSGSVHHICNRLQGVGPRQTHHGNLHQHIRLGRGSLRLGLLRTQGRFDLDNCAVRVLMRSH